MVDTGILEECSASEWALPSFIVVKKDGQVRHISNLQTLSNYVKCKKSLLPIIHDSFAVHLQLEIRRKTWYSYVILDLDKESLELFVIITPFGKYKYNCLSMGLKSATNFAQQIIDQVLQDAMLLFTLVWLWITMFYHGLHKYSW